MNNGQVLVVNGVVCVPQSTLWPAARAALILAYDLRIALCQAHCMTHYVLLHLCCCAAAVCAGKCVLSFNDQLNAEQHVAEALKALKA